MATKAAITATFNCMMSGAGGVLVDQGCCFHREQSSHTKTELPAALPGTLYIIRKVRRSKYSRCSVIKCFRGQYCTQYEYFRQPRRIPLYPFSLAIRPQHRLCAYLGHGPPRQRRICPFSLTGKHNRGCDTALPQADPWHIYLNKPQRPGRLNGFTSIMLWRRMLPSKGRKFARSIGMGLALGIGYPHTW